MKKTALLSLVASSILMAGGYNIPETSTNAVALGAANIAHNHNNADAAYYNPAKMVYMSDVNHVEVDVTYIGLEKVNYSGTVYGTGPYSFSSEGEDFIVPTLHYVSGDLGNNLRFGLSLVSPGGLSKRWENSIASYTAKEFTLETIELNPTIAMKVMPNLSLAAGFRVIKSSGIVKAAGLHPALGAYSQDMNGDSIDYGYNLALAYNPTKDLEIGVTYRSRVDLTEEGDANLYSSNLGLLGNYVAAVTVPLPASLHVAAAYTLPSKTTVEFVYERTYWSAYHSLNFEYAYPLAEAAFGGIRAKDWHNTNTYRLGVTQEMGSDFRMMAGFVYDESPIPEHTLGFELPDTDTMAFSLGGRYQVSKAVDFGFSALYSMHKDRTVNNLALHGEFTGGNVLIVSAGLGYKF